MPGPPRREREGSTRFRRLFEPDALELDGSIRKAALEREQNNDRVCEMKRPQKQGPMRQGKIMFDWGAKGRD